MSSSFFQNMAPNARRSFVVTVLLGGAAALMYLFAVQPTEMALANARREFDEQSSRLQMVDANLRGASANKERLAALDAALKPFLDEMLEPHLGSCAMRAKSILDTLAVGAGLSNMDYSDMPPRALPLPQPLPVQLHRRQPVRFTAHGSYMGAISFLMRVEKEHPLVALQSMSISSTTEPERQQIEMVFEWPAKGGRSK